MTTAVTSQEHLIGLMLGAEEDWPTAFEALARRLGVIRDGQGVSHSLRKVWVVPSESWTGPTRPRIASKACGQSSSAPSNNPIRC